MSYQGQRGAEAMKFETWIIVCIIVGWALDEFDASIGVAALVIIGMMIAATIFPPVYF